jgi:hypothetical protein
VEKPTGDFRKLHNEEPHNVYSSPYVRELKSRKTRWNKHVACMGEMRNAYKISFGISERMRQLERLDLDDT